MAGFRRPEIPREQLVLWKHQLDDAIPVDHPVRDFDYLLRSEAFAETFGACERQYVLAEGKPPYHPRDLAGLYLYGMMNGIRSSRQLEAACWNRLDVIWLMSGQRPDHSTIAPFVRRHKKTLRSVFRDVLQVGIRAGVITLSHVSVDGTKAEADAGKGTVRSQAQIASELSRLDAAIARLEAEWSTQERRESTLFGSEVPWRPEGCGTDRQRLARMKAKQGRLSRALASIARRSAESVDRRGTRAICSTTDPDSRVMPDKEGKSKPNYNPQAAVDAERGMIVASEVTDAPDDTSQLTPMVDRVAENCGQLPEEVSADSGYATGPAIAALEQNGVRGYLPESGQRSESPSPDTPAARAVSATQRGETLSEAAWSALPKDGKGRITKAAFRYDGGADVYRCPMGQMLPFVRSSRDVKKWGVAIRRQYGESPACRTCVRASMCCANAKKGRTVNHDQYEGHRRRMRARMSSAAGRSRYRLRRETVEPRFGVIKRVLGVRRFLRRGLSEVRTEWLLACLAVNVGVLLKHWQEVRPML